jgi:hypothetical protein
MTGQRPLLGAAIAAAAGKNSIIYKVFLPSLLNRKLDIGLTADVPSLIFRLVWKLSKVKQELEHPKNYQLEWFYVATVSFQLPRCSLMA